jgi:hypothetical protein
MDVGRIVSEIDAEIARLQQARAALTAIGASGTVAPRRGRPKGSVNKKAAAKPRRKRNLTPEGRKRIAEAMKRRWAERRAATKSSSKKG